MPCRLFDGGSALSSSRMQDQSQKARVGQLYDLPREPRQQTLLHTVLTLLHRPTGLCRLVSRDCVENQQVLSRLCVEAPVHCFDMANLSLPTKSSDQAFEKRLAAPVRQFTVEHIFIGPVLVQGYFGVGKNSSACDHEPFDDTRRHRLGRKGRGLGVFRREKEEPVCGVRPCGWTAWAI